LNTFQGNFIPPVDYLHDLKLFFAWAGNPSTAITLHEVDTYIDHGRRLVHAIATVNRLDYFYEDGVPTDLGWDANGNLRAQGTNVYTWDAANRLVAAEVDGVVSAYEYDGLGNRVAQTVGGVTTEYMLDVADGLPEVIVATTGGASTRYVQVQGQVLAQQDSGAWTYILPDHLGSVRQLVGSDSQVDLARSFDPFGVPFETSGSGESDFGYTGEWWNSYMELVFLRARYYDPVVGRFLAKDPWLGDILRPLTLNGWSYLENNSISFVDPSGHIKEGQEAKRADIKVKSLHEIYQVQVLKDWGFVLIPGIPSWGIPPSCRWEEGDWTMKELETLQDGVANLANAMGGASKFIANIGGVTVSQDNIGARGLTWPHLIKFTNSPDSFDEWAVIHELGHAWDASFGWRLSKGLEEFTGGHTDRVEWYEKLLAGQCDPDQRLPGCNNAGYFYRGSPPAGSNWRFNRKEDFAESVVGYVHEDWVRAEVERFADEPQLRRFLYYRDYTHTLRWAYIDGLINGTVTIH
jgi:RHS repeat-associated protein